MKKEHYRTAVVIGRFQPFHNYHFRLVTKALELADNVIIGLGSSNVAPNVRNPFPPMDREKYIRACFPQDQQSRMAFVWLRDCMYNDEQWKLGVQTQIAMRVSADDSVVLVGTDKDASTAYLSWFPQWKRYYNLEVGDYSGTVIRDAYFGSYFISDKRQDTWSQLVPEPVAKYLREFYGSPEYRRLAGEWLFVRDYKAAWGTAPYPPTFVTADAVVKCSGHILVNERMQMPGKGLWCLPGGFVLQDETVRAAAIRELKEETGIRMYPGELDKTITGEHVFDAPGRSLRGRTITHAFLFDLGNGPLPEIRRQKGEVKKTWWMPYTQIAQSERRFFEDHSDIINYFIGI